MNEVTHAVLGPEREIVPCTYSRYNTWFCRRGGWRLSRIRTDLIAEWKLETQFAGRSPTLDGPHLWWLVRLSNPPSKGGFLFLPRYWGYRRCETLRETLGTLPPVVLEAYFLTLKLALNFYRLAQKEVRAKEKLVGTIREKAQELLAQLAFWCEQEWGRQSLVARTVGTSPQMVNDWINGRKKMAGEQALRVEELLKKQLRTGRRHRQHVGLRENKIPDFKGIHL